MLPKAVRNMNIRNTEKRILINMRIAESAISSKSFGSVETDIHEQYC
jgi:hypothetical protein